MKYVLFKTNNQSKIMNNLTISQENQRTHNYVHVLPAKIFKINTDWNPQCYTSIIPGHYNYIWVSDKGRELLSSDLHDVDGVVEDGTVVVGDTGEPADGGRARGLL